MNHGHCAAHGAYGGSLCPRCISPGHRLYVRFIAAPGSDAEREWWLMNGAIKDKWEALAVTLASDLDRANLDGFRQGYVDA